MYTTYAATIAARSADSIMLTFKWCLLAAQVQGHQSYVTKSSEPPVDLAAYKYAKAKWEGTDNGAFQAWLHDRNFPQLSSYSRI